MPRCPSCNSPMTRVEEGDFRWAVCANCFGTWIGSVMLLRRLRTDVQNPPPVPQAGDQPATLEDLAQTVAASNTKAILRCPECDKPMSKDRVQPMIPVQIDRCTPCQMVWLDAGEMELLRRLYRELMTSTDPEIVQKRERIGTLMADWEAGRHNTLDVPGGAVTTVVDVGLDLLQIMLRGRM